MKKPVRLTAVCVLLLLTLCGCVSATAEDLYTPPLLSERYLNLQTSINQLLRSGAEYAPPASGLHRQAMQLEDLDGDGAGEVLAYLNFPGSDRPLRIYIFRRNGDEYEEAACIEGEGSGIDSVRYVDMDGDGVKEIAVGWQIAPGLNLLSVFTIKEYQVSQVVSTAYTEYTVCSLNRSDRSEVMALRLSPSELTGEVELFSLAADGEVVSSSARLSNGLDSLLRVRSTSLRDGSSAVFLEGHLNGGGFITDILTCQDGVLRNATLNETGAFSESTIRNPEIYCQDINGDGVLDVPKPVPLPSSSGTPYYRIEWYDFAADGSAQLALHTYNNTSDGWYLILPETWIDHIAIHRSDGVAGERAIVFSRVDSDGVIREDFLVIYALTGDKREERASASSRFLLRAEEDAIYAAVILGSSSSLGFPISQQLVRSNFGLIYSEWITGAT